MIGSFLNVVIDRVPQEKSLVSPPSHCDKCGHLLAPRDLIPLLSFLWLKGRCRYCGERLPLRMPLVELATGIVFALLGLVYGLSLEFLISVVYAGFFIPLFVIDLEQGILPDRIVFAGMAVSLGLSFLWLRVGPLGALTDGGAGLLHFGYGGAWRYVSPLNALVGGGVGLLFLLLPYLISRRGMGLGDVKLAAFLGLATGFPSVLVAMLLAVIAGGIVAIVLVGLRKRGRKDAMPFGPYLVTAGMITLLWGQSIMKWYLALF